MSTFSGLNTALTSLYAQRKAIDVTGQNIANVNTDGYSRQRADLQSIGGSAIPAIFSTSPGVGGGVDSEHVIRIRNLFLDARAQVEHASNSLLTEQANTMGQIEQSFREPGDTGLQSLMDDMWAGWGDVANQPNDTAARSQVLQQMTTVASSLHSTRTALDQQWNDSHENLTNLVSEVNTSAAGVAELNQAIQRANQSGLPANELTDKRDALVLKLAEQIGATSRPGDDGVTNVFVGGTPLVFGSTATKLQVAGATKPDDVATNTPHIETTGSTYPVTVGGTAKANLSALTDTLPTYRARLDGVAANLAASINAGQANGYDLDGNPGAPLLSSGPAGGPVTAANITVAITDPRKIAAAAVAPAPPPAPASFDGGNADAISQLQLDPAGATVTYRQVVVDLAVQAQGVYRSQTIQSSIATQVDAARESASGVNLDEEMSNMLAFQHAYQAAGRLVTAIDENLDTLINRTGMVGR